MKRYLQCILLMLFMLLPFCTTNKVMAKSTLLLRCQESDMTAQILEKTFSLKKRSDVTIDLLSDSIDSEGKASLIIYDSKNSAVVTEEMEDACFSDGDIQHQYRLNAGEYRVVVIPVQDNESFSFFLEITAEDISPYDGIQFTISNKSIKLYKGNSKQLSVIAKPKNAKYPLKWKSSNKNIATVTPKGMVHAKKEGTATITATAGDTTLNCTITVRKKIPTYNQIAKLLKSYQGKNFTFRSIDVGHKCRLYTKGIVSTTDSATAYNKGYAMVCSFQPYIELTREGNTPKLKLVMSGKLYEANAFEEVDLVASQLHMYTSNRILDYDITNSKENSHYNYQKDFYVGKTIWTTALSSNINERKADTDKFSKMLQQGSFHVRIKCLWDTYFDLQPTKHHKTCWNRLIKIYKQASKEL